MVTTVDPGHGENGVSVVDKASSQYPKEPVNTSKKV